MSADHCNECVTGYFDEGKPTGQDILLDGVIPCYVAKASVESDKAIILITDIFGFEIVNIRLMADKIAARGLTVYVPDLHSGKSLGHEIYVSVTGTPDAGICGQVLDGVRFFASLPSLISWMGQHGEKETIPILDRVISAINKLGFTKLGTQGFCWGGKYSVMMGAGDKFKAIVAAHPSMLKMPNDIQAINVPALFLCAEVDFTFSKADLETTKGILAEKGPNNVVKVYTGVKHGFTVRGDEKNPIVNAARIDALETSIDFFLKHLV